MVTNDKKLSERKALTAKGFSLSVHINLDKRGAEKQGKEGETEIIFP
jgi:hypothetical protein